jgi:FMN-dependent NADH-azoreductase
MKLLLDLLALNFSEKDSVSVRMPTFNIADPASITTWLDLRRIVATAGMRFRYRLTIGFSVFCSSVLTAVIFGFLVAVGAVRQKVLDKT